jgi:hypothetical protein
MRSGRAIAALALLPALLTGCGPKPQKAVVPPVVAEAPSLPPSRMIATLSPVPPAIPIADPPPVKLDTTIPPEPKTVAAATEPHHATKHHAKPDQVTLVETKPSPSSTAQSPAQTTQEATAQPPEMSKIGPLSTTDDNGNVGDRNSISSQIDSTENGLNAIKRPLSSDEQKTAALIRSYVTRARDALKADDLTAATNLSTKAHQLLGELTKPQ